MISYSDIENSHKQFYNSCLLSNYAIACNYFTKIPVLNFFVDYFEEFDYDFSDPITYFDNPRVNNFLITAFGVHFFSNFNAFIKDYASYKAKNISIADLLSRYGPIFHTHFIMKSYKGMTLPNEVLKSDITGYSLILKLHDNIDKPAFLKSRNTCNIHFLGEKNKIISSKNSTLFASNNISELYMYLTINPALINIFDTKIQHSLTIYCEEGTKQFILRDTNVPNHKFYLPYDWIGQFQNGEILLFENKSNMP
ncbi:MAG: hypothetical protein KQI35_17225 [Bacteroidetes bacterium]|nr:hypothetical protein [Bacteroidota bacterium]